MSSLPPYSLSDPSVLAFVAIPAVLVLLLIWGVAVAWRRAGSSDAHTFRAVTLTLGGSIVWMTATWLVAQSGVLLDWNSTPPPFGVLVVAIVCVALALAFGPVGQRLATHVSLAALVAVQAFRLPLELAMHRMAERGIMPEQMTYTGRNFDIVTGATAIIVSLLVWSGLGGRRLVATWNLLGLALLVNIVVVAIISTPRFQVFGPNRLNVWVMLPPFVWLPAVMVLAALAGHLVVWRALKKEVRST